LITAGVLVSQEGLCMFPRLVQIQNFISIFINSGYNLNKMPYQYATLHEILEWHSVYVLINISPFPHFIPVPVIITNNTNQYYKLRN